MSSDTKIEANRRNAQKSTGPKSEQGKNRSRFNALKHDMRALLPVLPGENGDAFAARVDAWTEDLKPRTEVEQYLIDRAAGVSWQLDRLERAHVARLTANIQNAEAGANQVHAQAEVLMLGCRLFSDDLGPMPLYPHSPFSGNNPRRFVSWSGITDDPNNPALVVHFLESTAPGCAWLLDRWGELRSLLEQNRAWQSPDKFKAVRLLGKQPIDALDDSQVGMIFLACHTIDPSGGELFHEVWNELKYSEIENARARLRGRPLDVLKPRDGVEARQALLNIVDRAIDRLKTLAESHRKLAALNASLSPALLGFDDSVEGERLRRYEASCSRTLLRTLDALVKVRKTTKEMDLDSPVADIGVVPPLIEEDAVEPLGNFDPTTMDGPSVAPIVATAPIASTETFGAVKPAGSAVRQSPEPDRINDDANSPNKANADADPHDNGSPNEATDESDSHDNSPPNEANADDHDEDWVDQSEAWAILDRAADYENIAETGVVAPRSADARNPMSDHEIKQFMAHIDEVMGKPPILPRTNPTFHVRDELTLRE